MTHPESSPLSAFHTGDIIALNIPIVIAVAPTRYKGAISKPTILDIVGKGVISQVIKVRIPPISDQAHCIKL